MKRTFLALTVLGSLVAAGVGQTSADENSAPFVEPGLLSIQSPHPSMQWRKERTQKTDVTTAHFFVCSTNQKSTPLILVVDERAATEAFQRQTLVFENYKVARTFVEKLGFQVVKAKVPEGKDSAKNRVVYSVVGKHPQQDLEMYIGGMIMFSKHRTYTLQAMSPSANSTKQMLGVATTLKEILPETK